jgi:hypothetical protein
MKYPLLPSIAALFLIASGGVCAGEPATSTIEIVSVVPRSPDVKPLAMSVPADGRHETAALVRPRASAASDTGPGKIANVDSQKAVPFVSGNKQ